MKSIVFITLLLFGCGMPSGKTIETCNVHGEDCHGGAATSTETEGPQGVTGVQESPGKDGSSCSATQKPNGVLISCTDGTSGMVTNGTDGVNGTNGTNGVNGTNGTNGKNGQDGAQGIQGPEGATGPQGAVGPMGPEGIPGLNGSSCSVESTANGAQVSCSDGTSVLILNGVNGTNGTNGLNGTLVTPEKLCADGSSEFPEYGFKIGNSIYAVYYGYLNSHGNPSGASGQLEAFMSKLIPGNYMSTNGTGCTFSIDASGNIHN